MQFRAAEIFPLVGIAIGFVVAQFLGLEGPTTAFFALFAVIAAGYYAGPRLIGRAPILIATAWGTFSALAILMLLRGAWFYLGFALDGWASLWTTIAMLAITIGFMTLIDEGSTDDVPAETSTRNTIIEFVVCIASILGFLAIVYAAREHGTIQTIRTPWPLMPKWTLALIGLLWALALATAWKLRRACVASVQVICALGALTVIAPLIYVIGYGFDGFLHVAGETVLAKTGYLTPKPPYYMGQYVLVTWIVQLFDAPLAMVDRWLVPVTAALLIPAAAWLSSRKAVTTMVALVLIPLGAFVATTPHGFATVLGVVSLLLATSPSVIPTESPGDERRDPFYRASSIALLFALWSTLTHPLVGLPILCAIAAIISWKWFKGSLGILLALFAGISVPLVFGLASNLGSAAGVNFDVAKMMDPATWGPLLSEFIPFVPNRYALWPQAAAWIVELLPWVTILFVGTSIFSRQKDEDRTLAPWIIAATSTFIAALVLKISGDFGFLIDYERGNYADRLFMVAWLLLLPVAIPEFGRRLEAAGRAPFINKIAVLVAVALLGAGSSYAALPRHDQVVPSRGWSVGQSDINAVKLIDEDAHGEPYTVLANQSVSAAAVKTFGFKRYYGDVFFYPIPTGGPLYDVYLRASYEDPSRETMREAGKLGGSKLVYFVVNDYWWDAQTLSEKATSSTDREFLIDNGKVKVFKYELK
jgi:hypothetical protein